MPARSTARRRTPVLVTAMLACVLPLVAQQPALIRPGDRDLLRARMPLGADTIDNYVLEFGRERLAGSTVRVISLVTEGQDRHYEIRTAHWQTDRDTSHSVMAVRVRDLSLVFHRVKGPRDSAAVTVAAGHLTGWVVLPDRPILLLDRRLERPVFGVEGQVPWLLPLLPLAPGYRAVVPHFSQWAGVESADTVAVIGREPVVIGDRTFDCWHLDAGPLGPPGYRAHLWIDAATRRVVQAAVRSDRPATEWRSRRRV